MIVFLGLNIMVAIFILLGAKVYNQSPLGLEAVEKYAVSQMRSP